MSSYGFASLVATCQYWMFAQNAHFMHNYDLCLYHWYVFLDLQNVSFLQKLQIQQLFCWNGYLGAGQRFFFLPLCFLSKSGIYHSEIFRCYAAQCERFTSVKGQVDFLLFFITYKSCIQETLTLSTCTDCSTVTMKHHIFFSHFFVQFYAIFYTLLHLLAYIFFLSLFVMGNTSWVPCYMSVVMCDMSCVTVTCHLPPVTNANSHSHGPSPANSIIRYILTLRISSAGYW